MILYNEFFKLIKVIILFITLYASNTLAFDLERVDYAVKSFIGSLWSNECSSIRYSYIDLLYVGEAHTKGFYAAGVSLSDFKPDKLPTDIYVKIKTIICSRSDGYHLTLRKSKDGYEIISYSSFSQPI